MSTHSPETSTDSSRRRNLMGLMQGESRTQNSKFKVKDYMLFQKGSSFPVQVVDGPNDVVTGKPIMNLVISIFGVKLFDPATNKVNYEYELEQILMHDYNISSRMFMFRIADNRSLTSRTHTVVSEDYMDIYSYLGRAIALLSYIKEKSQIESATTNSMYDDGEPGPDASEVMGIPGIRAAVNPRNRSLFVFRGLSLEDGPTLPPAPAAAAAATGTVKTGYGTIRFSRSPRAGSLLDTDGELSMSSSDNSEATHERASASLEAPISPPTSDSPISTVTTPTSIAPPKSPTVTPASNASAEATVKASESYDQEPLTSPHRNKTMKASKLTMANRKNMSNQAATESVVKQKRSGGVELLQTLFGLNFDGSSDKEKENDKEAKDSSPGAKSPEQVNSDTTVKSSNGVTGADSKPQYEGNRHISEEDDLSNVTVARSMYTKYYIQKRYRMTLQKASMANQQLRAANSSPASTTASSEGANPDGSSPLTRSEGSLRSLGDSDREGGRKASSETSLDEKGKDIAGDQQVNIKRSKSRGNMLNVKKFLTIKRREKEKFRNGTGMFDDGSEDGGAGNRSSEQRRSLESDRRGSVLSDIYDATTDSSTGTISLKRRLSITSTATTAGTVGRARNSIDSLSPRQDPRPAYYGEWVPETLNKTRLKTNPEGKEILVESLKQNKYEITAGTIDALIESLASEGPPDSLYIETFLLTYKHFISSDLLIMKLKDRFSSFNKKVPFPPPEAKGKGAGTEMNEIIQLRTVGVLKKWTERHMDDFTTSPTTKQLLFDFLDLMSNTNCASYAEKIKALVEMHVESESKKGSKRILEPIAIERGITDAELSTWSARVMAQQLTLADLELFKAIRPDEFIYWLWGGNEDPRKMRNLTNFINRFNTIGFWVASMICQTADLRRRIEVLEKAINIARHCYKLQNFNAAMAILSGLNTTSVHRLKKTWSGISGRFQALYKELEAKFNYSSNYKTYRETEITSRPPLIPFFGLYIRDLTFMNDGNQKILANGLINFEKNRAISEKVTAIRLYQQSKFDFVSDPKIYPFFTNLPCLPEESLQEESQKREPPAFRYMQPDLTSSSSSIAVSGQLDCSTEDLSIDSSNLTPSVTSSPYSTIGRSGANPETSSLPHDALSAPDIDSLQFGSLVRNGSALSLSISVVEQSNIVGSSHIQTVPLNQ